MSSAEPRVDVRNCYNLNALSKTTKNISSAQKLSQPLISSALASVSSSSSSAPTSPPVLIRQSALNVDDSIDSTCESVDESIHEIDDLLEGVSKGSIEVSVCAVQGKSVASRLVDLFDALASLAGPPASTHVSTLSTSALQPSLTNTMESESVSVSTVPSSRS